jgi:membrane-bound ClpP family serine protease
MWKLPINILLGLIVAGKIILFFWGWLVWRSYRQDFGARQSRMIGLSGKALTDIEREGRVMVQGEYWWARARVSIPAGANVRVTNIDGMSLEVESCPDKDAPPRPMSALMTAENNFQ